MSEPIPESIPTSADPRSHRPTKKRALTPLSKQAANVEALFAKPDQALKVGDRPEVKGLAPPPDIMTNVQGSSAGAGSGEFHVYKASRRREYERVRMMDEESRKEKEDAEHEAKIAEMKKKDEEKLSKNQKRRAKAKERAAKKKNGVKSGDDEGGDKAGIKKLGALKPKIDAQDEAEDTAEGVGAPSAAEEDQGITIQDDD